MWVHVVHRVYTGGDFTNGIQIKTIILSTHHGIFYSKETQAEHITKSLTKTTAINNYFFELPLEPEGRRMEMAKVSNTLNSTWWLQHGNCKVVQQHDNEGQNIYNTRELHELDKMSMSTYI